MSSVPSGLPEPIPSQPKPLPPRGRDRALSSSPKESGKTALPPSPASAAPPQPTPTQTKQAAAAAPAYEYGVSDKGNGGVAAMGLPSRYALPTAPSGMRNHLTAWLIMLAIAGIALAFTVPFTLGVYLGNQDRAAFVERQAQEHFQRALAYESETYTQLAIAELELALQYKPDYQPAQDKLTQLKNAHINIAEQEPQDVAIAKQLYDSAAEAVQKEDWSSGIDLFEELRRVKSDYRSSEVDAYLVQAYVAAGKQALLANDVDLARRRFDAALAIDPNNTEARAQQKRAELYFAGVAFMGVSWGSAVTTLAELYTQDPNFGDIKIRLRESHIGYGDFASTQGAFCIAAREYNSAISLGAIGEVVSKGNVADENCKFAISNPTPLPTATPEGGILTPDPFITPIIGTPAPGAAAGGVLYAPGMRVRQNAPCNGTGDIRGSIQTAAGDPIPNVGVKIYNDFGYLPPYARSDPAGEYEIALGSDAGQFHLVIVDDFGSNASAVLNVDYPGGNVQGCHIVVNWTRIK